jgi:cell division protein FtsB
MKDQQDYLLQRIEALEKENKRLNDELRKVKKLAFKVQLSDPNFDKPLSEINVNYEIVNPY